MATGSFIAVTPGSGAKLATGPTYTENANVVQDEKVMLGEQYLASYVIATGSVTVATANDHLLQIVAGASLKVRIRRIRIQLFAPPAAAGTLGIHILRLASAGTGGAVPTANNNDPADSGAGMTAMTQPTVKGTESGTALRKFSVGMPAAQPVTNAYGDEWVQLPMQKPIIIPAGVGNGLVLKLVAGSVATATVVINVDADESAF